jgi:hypothetical protein
LNRLPLHARTAREPWPWFLLATVYFFRDALSWLQLSTVNCLLPTVYSFPDSSSWYQLSTVCCLLPTCGEAAPSDTTGSRKHRLTICGRRPRLEPLG